MVFHPCVLYGAGGRAGWAAAARAGVAAVFKLTRKFISFFFSCLKRNRKTVFSFFYLATVKTTWRPVANHLLQVAQNTYVFCLLLFSLL